MNRSGRFSLRRWALLTLLLGSVAGATTPFTVRFGASGSGVRLEIPIDPPIEPDLTSFQLGFRVDAARPNFVVSAVQLTLPSNHKPKELPL